MGDVKPRAREHRNLHIAAYANGFGLRRDSL